MQCCCLNYEEIVLWGMVTTRERCSLAASNNGSRDIEDYRLDGILMDSGFIDITLGFQSRATSYLLPTMSRASIMTDDRAGPEFNLDLELDLDLPSTRKSLTDCLSSGPKVMTSQSSLPTLSLS